MEPVKTERVSPIMGETGTTYDTDPLPRQRGNAPQTHDHDLKPPPPAPGTSYLPSYSTAAPITGSSCTLSSHPTVISTTSSVTRTTTLINRTIGGNSGNAGERNSVAAATLEHVLLTGNNFSGDISDAVSKILEDYDWSKIPLANKDATGSERRKVHVKRPMNAFMVWAQEARRKLSCSHRQVHNAELSKSLGRIWRGMTEDQKRPFIERADHLRRKHKQEYPDYKYQPRRRKENVKTVSKCPQGNHVNMHDLTGNHHFASSVKGGLSIHPLSPPSSPSNQVAVKDPSLGDTTVFVPDCLTDNFENIDRSELNKYLIPIDQGAAAQYAVSTSHVGSGGLQPMTTMASMSAVNTMAVPSNSNGCSNTQSSGSSSSLTALPSIGSRLLPPSAPFYGGPSSPYNTGGASPHNGGHGSPDLIIGDIGTPTGGVSPGGSPGSPGEYVELQPRAPALSAPKPSNVNPFLHQNLCYSTQPYTAFQYSYPYATMWH